MKSILNFSEVQRRLSIYFRFWKRGGGFKEDDAVWAEPKMPQNTGLPELKALNPDHCFVAALGMGIRLKASKIHNLAQGPKPRPLALGTGIRLKASKIYN